MKGFLDSGKKELCFGCEACLNICTKNAVTMKEDTEGFRYPVINQSLCVECKACRMVCPAVKATVRCDARPYVFGGYSRDPKIRFNSTSGGAFSEIVNAFCDHNYVIFGARAKGIFVYHSYITDKRELWKFRKSKYMQSVIGTSYKKVRQFLEERKKVVFSGTPCQIAGLKAYLGNMEQKNLLTVEVVCESVPSPLYMRKFEQHIQKKYGMQIKSLDYRYKGKALFGKGRWDFQIMRSKLSTVKHIGGGGRWDFEEMRIIMSNEQRIKVRRVDRWFNPFWSVWLNHLISRPSCYHCPFAAPERVADITLGDLWGVHIYCPELYGENGGSSLVICNTEIGKRVFEKARKAMYGHELELEDVLKYQGPMRKSIVENPDRSACMQDLKSSLCYKRFVKKWGKKPSLKLLWSKYIYGNRQKVWLWEMRNRKKTM